MSMSNSKPSCCKSDTSKMGTSKTNAAIPKVHMSVSNSNTSKPTSCKAYTSQSDPAKSKTDTSKPSSSESNTSKMSSSKSNACIAKVDMPTSTNQTDAWTCNKPTLERSIEGEKLSITVSY